MFFPIVIGLLIIAPYFSIKMLSIWWVLGMHIVSGVYCSLLFLTLTFFPSFVWMIDNLWPRVLFPLFTLSPIFYPLKNVQMVSPLLASLFLLNPFTYIVEGFRGAFLGVEYSIHPLVCIGVLIFFSLIHVGLLSKVLYTKMDLV